QYRLTDPLLDPPGEGDLPYSERSVRLQTYWCYEPAIDGTAVKPPPCSSTGHVTFGCLNNFSKVSDGALATWARLLRELPGAALLLHAHEGSHRRRVLAVMAREQVDPRRIA